MIVEIELENGGAAEICSLEGNVLIFVSPRAFALGAPIRFDARLGDRQQAFEGRTIGARRVEGDRFEIRMRFVNLRRGDRAALVAAMEG